MRLDDEGLQPTDEQRGWLGAAECRGYLFPGPDIEVFAASVSDRIVDHLFEENLSETRNYVYRF